MGADTARRRIGKGQTALPCYAGRRTRTCGCRQLHRNTERTETMNVSHPSSLDPRLSTLLPVVDGGTHVREVHDHFHGDLLEVSMGPHHPSTHGVFRMMVTLDGETIVKLKPVFGYLHRNHEKLGENTSYLGSMPYTDRRDYLNSMTNDWAFAPDVDKLPGLSMP